MFPDLASKNCGYESLIAAKSHGDFLLAKASLIQCANLQHLLGIEFGRCLGNFGKGHMCPSASHEDSAHVMTLDTKSRTNFSARSAFGIKAKYFCNLIGGKFRHAICFTFILAVLRHLVGDVIRMRSEKQVGRIHARRIVAPVEHKCCPVDLAEVYRPRNPVSSFNPSIVVSVNYTVAEKIPRACPSPTPSNVRNMVHDWAIFRYFRPKPLLEGLPHKSALVVNFHGRHASMVPTVGQ